MAFDAETYTAPAAADSSRDILSPAILAALPADKAQALYDLAAQVDHPKVWKLAAHALAGSLARLLATAAAAPVAEPAGPISPAQPSSPISPARNPKRQSAPRLAAGDDLAAPLAAPPRNKTAVGDFHAVWADGSVTRVTGVIYHTAKPATRWAAAFQAADRLRRLRGRDAYVADLAQTATVARQIRGACGIFQDSPDFQTLTQLRAMPPLLAIYEADGETFDAPAGSAFGAGDAIAARAIEARLCTPRHPMSQSARAAEFRTNVEAARRSQDLAEILAAAPDMIQQAEAAPLATAEAFEPCGPISLHDLDGAAVVIDAGRIAQDRAPNRLEDLKTAVHDATHALKAADSEAEAADAQDALDRAKAALALGHRLHGAAGDLLANAGKGAERILYTLRRGIAGKTFDLQDSNGRRVLFGADLLPWLATARAAQPLALAA